MTGAIHCPEITASKSKEKDRNFHVVPVNLVILGHPILSFSMDLWFSQQKVGMIGYWELSETSARHLRIQLVFVGCWWSFALTSILTTEQ